VLIRVPFDVSRNWLTKRQRQQQRPVPLRPLAQGFRRLGPNGCGMRCLDVAMLDVAKRPQLLFRRFERLSYRNTHIGTRIVFLEVVGFSTDDQMSMRRVHIHMHLINIAFAVLLAARFDGHATGNEAAVEFLELGDALAYVGGKTLGRRHIMEGDFEWNIHVVPRRE